MSNQATKIVRTPEMHNYILKSEMCWKISDWLYKIALLIAAIGLIVCLALSGLNRNPGPSLLIFAAAITFVAAAVVFDELSSKNNRVYIRLLNEAIWRQQQQNQTKASA